MLSLDCYNHCTADSWVSLQGHINPTPWFARPVQPIKASLPSGSDSSESEYVLEKSFYPSNNEELKSLRMCRPKFSTAEKGENLPADPRSWNREDVQNWIKRTSDLHNLPSVEADRFLMNGKALCLMTMDMFCQRVPLGGKMLYKDFQLRLSTAMYSSK